MAFTLWLSAEEEHVLERIMRVEGTRTKQQAVIRAILDKGAHLAATQQAQAGQGSPAQVPIAQAPAIQLPKAQAKIT